MTCQVALRKKCPYSELFWSPFSCILIECWEIRSLTCLIFNFARPNSSKAVLLLIYLRSEILMFNPIQKGPNQKGSPTSFCPVTSTNVGISPKTFWLLVLTLLTDWCKIWILYLVSLPNCWTWTKTTSQKKWFFWLNPYKIEVVITSLREMLQLPNFNHMNTSTI